MFSNTSGTSVENFIHKDTIFVKLWIVSVYMDESKLLDFVTKLTSKRQKNLLLFTQWNKFLINRVLWMNILQCVDSQESVSCWSISWSIIDHSLSTRCRQKVRLGCAFSSKHNRKPLPFLLIILIVEQAVSRDFRFCLWSTETWLFWGLVEMLDVKSFPSWI